VTGSARGIGRHLAEHLVGHGFHVVGCSKGQPEQTPEHYEHHAVDVADESAVRSMFESVRCSHGRLDVLINNAGVAAMNHFLLTPTSTAEQLLRVNVLGTFTCSREACRLMRRAGGGRIVNLASVAVPMRLAGEAAYVASKAAVVSLTQVLSMELAPFGITVNAVGPAPMRTDLLRGVPDTTLQGLLERLPIRRFGEMRDVTNVIDFFLSPASDAVTGQTVFLNGA
jgi:3-oxoacyl-[acyl-carrier protein] reductase